MVIAKGTMKMNEDFLHNPTFLEKMGLLYLEIQKFFVADKV